MPTASRAHLCGHAFVVNRGILFRNLPISNGTSNARSIYQRQPYEQTTTGWLAKRMMSCLCFLKKTTNVLCVRQACQCIETNHPLPFVFIDLWIKRLHSISWQLRDLSSPKVFTQILKCPSQVKFLVGKCEDSCGGTVRKACLWRL